MEQIKQYLQMCSRTQEEVFEHFIDLGFNIVDGGVYFSNNSKITLVSHADTVHNTEPTLFKVVNSMEGLLDVNLQPVEPNYIISSPQGLGADDRTGCYILEAIFDSEHSTKFNYLILRDEEIGLVGAGEFAKSPNRVVLDSTELFVEFDRAGYDFVTYGNGNEKVITFLEDLGISHGKGSASDIKELSPAFQKPSLNLGVGYEKQHSLVETQEWDGIDNAIDIALALELEFGKSVLEIDEPVPTYTYGGYGGSVFGGYGSYEQWADNGFKQKPKVVTQKQSAKNRSSKWR